MKKSARLNISKKINNFNLSFTTQELKEMLEKEQDNFIQSKGRISSLMNHPELVITMDKQLRKYFSISEDKKMVFSVYRPEDNQGDYLEIHQQKENISDRIFICTQEDNIQLRFTSVEESFHIKPWEAYQMPSLLSQMIEIIFRNNGSFGNAPKKGFRSVKKSRVPNKRYIMFFEYIYTKDDLDKLSTSFKGLFEKKEDAQVTAALKKLMN